jgi:hypothetical protein
MPHCFQLTRKGETKPTALQDIDAELCQNLDLPFSEDKWAGGWYDLIGFSLACGRSFDEITDAIKVGIKAANKGTAQCEHGYQLLRINHYLSEHFSNDTWTEIDRR